MVGKYNHTLDAKGRLFVPAKLREELGEVFYVAMGTGARCLNVYTEADWHVLEEKQKTLSMVNAGRMRIYFANANKCEPDKQGRFSITANLRNYAGITQDVTFIGQGSHAEIWDTAAYEAMEAEMMTPEALTALMEELNF